MTILDEIAARRQHQIAKGYDAAHDDEHTDASIARGAAALALSAYGNITVRADRRRYGMYRGQEDLTFEPSQIWPWHNGFKPGTPRDALIDAAAMIVAEIERIDRPCQVCAGRGEIGGFVNAESGYQTDPCPRCAR